ncbi:hypothetical protein BSL78_17850 [Apostichopus japonicus]|uniref:Uncharacterized protein n=1 Tax=Stichopus japonicus TaxID=307972 RepID=A0A2G8KBE5_STIJA|nr:hypothetical protein BSL78_17850 [Apostichopus japonicus]
MRHIEANKMRESDYGVEIHIDLGTESYFNDDQLLKVLTGSVGRGSLGNLRVLSNQLSYTLVSNACEFADCGEDFDCKATLSGHTCIPSSSVCIYRVKYKPLLDIYPVKYKQHLDIYPVKYKQLLDSYLAKYKQLLDIYPVKYKELLDIYPVKYTTSGYILSNTNNPWTIILSNTNNPWTFILSNTNNSFNCCTPHIY